MEIQFENFCIYRNDEEDTFMVAVRNRMIRTHEQWEVAALSTEEAKQIHEELSKYF